MMVWSGSVGILLSAFLKFAGEIKKKSEPFPIQIRVPRKFCGWAEKCRTRVVTRRNLMMD